MKNSTKFWLSLLIVFTIGVFAVKVLVGIILTVIALWSYITMCILDNTDINNPVFIPKQYNMFYYIKKLNKYLNSL